MDNNPDFDADTYKAELAKYLAAWKPNIAVEMPPQYTTWKHTSGNEVTTGKTYFIEVTISESALSDKPVQVMIDREENQLNDNSRIWNEAYEVQEKYFAELGLDRGSPQSNSAYWKLWDFLDK